MTLVEFAILCVALAELKSYTYVHNVFKVVANSDKYYTEFGMKSWGTSFYFGMPEDAHLT